jgi:hypothetical protein
VDNQRILISTGFEAFDASDDDSRKEGHDEEVDELCVEAGEMNSGLIVIRPAV